MDARKFASIAARRSVAVSRLMYRHFTVRSRRAQALALPAQRARRQQASPPAFHR
jgi:hypothetical protein